MIWLPSVRSCFITFATVTFGEYLFSKKIDASAFQEAEAALYQVWHSEFDQMHINSFTVQKLNLINPIRRKYPLKEKPQEINTVDSVAPSSPPGKVSPARVARPVIKPKIN